MPRDDDPRPSRSAVVAFGLYAVGACALATAISHEFRAIVIVELVLETVAIALVAMRSAAPFPTGGVAIALALLGVTRVVLALGLGQAPALRDLRSLVESPSLALHQASPRMLLASAALIIRQLPLAFIAAVALAVLVAVRLRLVADRRWQAPLFVLPIALAPLLVPSESSDTQRLVDRVGRPMSLEPDLLRPLPSPPKLAPMASGERVIVVLLESLGRENLQRYRLLRPDDEFSKLLDRGVHFETVIAAANVSHLAQPAVLASYDFTRRAGNHLTLRTPERPLHTMARHYASRAARTLFFSSQDERWLGLDRISLEQPWDVARHSADAKSQTYVDACGVTKVFDSKTIADVTDALGDDEGAPAFAWINLQNGHFPYIVEADPALRDAGPFECVDFVSLPAAKLDEARRRADAAAAETFERVARLVESMPDATFLITGDHGEVLEAGPSFGHSKSSSMAEVATFALYLGPGITPRRVRDPISALDLFPILLDLRGEPPLPPGLVQGVSLPQRAARAIVTGSHGLGSAEHALVSGDLKLTLRGGTESCETLGGAPLLPKQAECSAATELLLEWLRCQTAMNAGASGEALSERFVSPCFETVLSR